MNTEIDDPESRRRLKRQAELTLEAIELIDSWDADFLKAVRTVLLADEQGAFEDGTLDDDRPRWPCPECGKLLTERRPVLHYRYNHKGIEAPDTWPPE